MTSRHKILFPLFALLLAACDRDGLLPIDALAMHVPTTKRRVASIKDVPRDVQTVFIGWLNPWRRMDISALRADQRERVAEAAAREWDIKDGREQWTGGCSAGEHFLEAGETEDGWWIFYEAGGIVDTSRLVLIKRVDGALKVDGSFVVRR